MIYLLVGFIFTVSAIVFKWYQETKSNDLKFDDLVNVFRLKEIHQSELFERQLHNMVVAMKTHTADEYLQNIVVKEKEKPKVEEEDPYQELEEVAEQDPEKFDKAIGIV